jgi:hypothetical protein
MSTTWWPSWPAYSQNPENSQPMAPPLALSWQQSMFGEQHWSGPDGQCMDTVFGSLHDPPPLLLPPLATGQQPAVVLHCSWPGGQPQS